MRGCYWSKELVSLKGGPYGFRKFASAGWQDAWLQRDQRLTESGGCVARLRGYVALFGVLRGGGGGGGSVSGISSFPSILTWWLASSL